jgi:hypothetical protein
MTSPIVIITAIESGFGFLLTSLILYLLLSRRRKAYHYLFAAFLFVCFFWDLGTFLLMIRNTHLNELETIGYIIGVPCGFIPILIFHFACQYTGRLIKWAIVLGWVLTMIFFVMGFFGLGWAVEGVYTYTWGNIFKVASNVGGIFTMVFWLTFNLSACWLLFNGAKKAASRLERRHYLYILTGILVITFAIVKVGVVMGINIPILLPLGMFLVDVFNAIIGLAIIKDRLFDITVIIKKGTLYSILAALLIFIYSFSEHMLVTYIGEIFKEYSTLAHFISIAVGIAILIPVKNRLERVMEGYFAQRKLEF